MMNGYRDDRYHMDTQTSSGLPCYEPPPPWIPPHERQRHPDYDNQLSLFLMRSVKFKRSKQTQQLGFNIRGGTEHKHGIYVSGVLENSSASRLGMKPGDQILSVNGVDFTNITSDEAVRILKNAEEIEIRLKYFPYGYEKTYRNSDSQPVYDPSFQPRRH